MAVSPSSCYSTKLNATYLFIELHSVTCRTNDYWAEFPYSVTIDTAASTAGWTDSEWVPTAATATSWWPNTFSASYAGAKVTFTVTAAEHPDYEWDRAISRRSTRRGISASTGVH
jgi:hypothetical protein